MTNERARATVRATGEGWAGVGRRGLASLMLLAVACGTAASPKAVTVADGWARATPAGENAAAYFAITNPSDSLAEVVRIESDVAEKTSLHQSMDHDGMVTMHGIDVLPVPAKQTFTLLPGGTHVMLEKTRCELKAGESFDLLLRLRSGDSVRVLVSVRAP